MCNSTHECVMVGSFVCMLPQQKCYHQNPWPWKHRVWHIWHHISHSFWIIPKIDFFDNGCPLGCITLCYICMSHIIYTCYHSRNTIIKILDPENIEFDTLFDIISRTVSELRWKLTFSTMAGHWFA